MAHRVWRYWHSAEEPAPYSRWIAATIDSLAGPGARVDLVGVDLPAQLLAVMPRLAAPTTAMEPEAFAAHVRQFRAHAANIVRWALLLEHGGVWLDHDVIPLVDVTALPRPWMATVGAEFVSCAIGLEPDDPLAGAMLAAGVEWGPFHEGDRAATASGDALLNGWAGPHRAAEIRRLARHHLAPIPLPFDATGGCVDGIYRADNTMARAPALVHLWHHREAERRNG